jgi:hypothetical protein
MALPSFAFAVYLPCRGCHQSCAIKLRLATYHDMPSLGTDLALSRNLPQYQDQLAVTCTFRRTDHDGTFISGVSKSNVRSCAHVLIDTIMIVWLDRCSNLLLLFPIHNNSSRHSLTAPRAQHSCPPFEPELASVHFSVISPSTRNW